MCICMCVKREHTHFSSPAQASSFSPDFLLVPTVGYTKPLKAMPFMLLSIIQDELRNERLRQNHGDLQLAQLYCPETAQ